MKISRLTAHRFTAFEHAEFEFVAGVNVLIGENGTGKSHVLKLLYALSEAVRRHVSGEGLDGSTGARGLNELVAAMLASVFLPDELGRLVRRAPGRRAAEVELAWDSGSVAIKLSSLGKVASTLTGDVTELARSVFLPTREVLSIFPGFVETWLRRESTFDRTYYDLCVALGLPPLRGARDATRAELLKPIEQALGANVEVKGGRFYLKHDVGGSMEAPLVAEGHRKLAMIAYLIINGSLTRNGFLFWDEPEASMNPKLSMLTRDVVFGMGKLGVQSFVTTHDYVLASELSLAGGAERAGPDRARFFALARETGAEVSVEAAAALNDLENNSILDAFVDLNGRERAAMLGRPEPR